MRERASKLTGSGPNVSEAEHRGFQLYHLETFCCLTSLVTVNVVLMQNVLLNPAKLIHYNPHSLSLLDRYYHTS